MRMNSAVAEGFMTSIMFVMRHPGRGACERATDPPAPVRSGPSDARAARQNNGVLAGSRGFGECDDGNHLFVGGHGRRNLPISFCRGSLYDKGTLLHRVEGELRMLRDHLSARHAARVHPFVQGPA